MTETEAWIAERKRKGDDPGTKAWLDERKREALLIDPATAEVDWSFGRDPRPLRDPQLIPRLARGASAGRPGIFRPTARERHLGSLSATSPTMSGEKLLEASGRR